MSTLPQPEPAEHHMLREIREQPDALRRTFAHYTDGLRLRMKAFGQAPKLLLNGELLIAASGSSRHAGLAAEVMLEDDSDLHVDVEYASEYITRPVGSLLGAPLLVISQSGATADTLAALRLAGEWQCQTIAVCNVEDSPMMSEATVALPTLAGIERAIPATKSFTTQLLVLALLSLLAAQSDGRVERDFIAESLQELRSLAEKIEAHLPAWEAAAQEFATRYANARSLLYLGRGIHYAIAREGALKLKECSYIHAEGYPAGELKHGPNALVSPESPLVVIATHDRHDEASMLRYEKTVALLEDMRAQGASILAVANHSDETVAKLAEAVFAIPVGTESALAIMEIVPLQLFAYYMAIAKGVDVDHPRNLVKAVVRE